MMLPYLRMLAGLCICALVAPMQASGQDTVRSFSDWLYSGEWIFDTRLRVESLDTDSFSEDASAITLRLRGGYETGRWNGFSALVDAEVTQPLGAEQYNSTTNDRTNFPIIPDPDGAEINRALIYYRRGPNHLKFGRQHLPIAQDRFLGRVDYRQNQQTYDALMLMHRSPSGWTLVYGYMDGVRRFLSDDNPLGDIDMNSHILNAEFKTPNEDRLTLYSQLLDMETPAVAAGSHRNIGIRYQGTAGSEALKWLYHVEYADQSSYADGDEIIDADYWLAEIGPRFANQWVVRFGVEHLSGNGVYAFQTPFANGHAYHGRADVFAPRTPDTGLQDQYLRIEAPLFGARAALSFHQFDSDTGNIDYGSEFDVVIAYRFRQRFQVDFEYSNYKANAFASDSQRFSISIQYSL